MEKFTKQDSQEIKKLIEEEKRPFLLKTEDGTKVAIVINKKSTFYWKRKGFISITVEELEKLVEGYKDIETQKQVIKEFLKREKLKSGVKR